MSSVGNRFRSFLNNIALTDAQISDGSTKHSGVRSCLNKHYYGHSSESANSMLVGSWGKNTRMSPPRDIDVLFELPRSVYERFELRPGNKQSQLLQEVKGVLQSKYPGTKMRADGQVVVVPFVSYAIELVPAFASGDQYMICDTNGGGRYKYTDPKAEIKAVKDSDDLAKGNTRHLIRMMKCWQYVCRVPIKSFWIELVGMEFLRQWKYAGNGHTYYDWMIRDFLSFLVNKSHLYVIVPGTSEFIFLGDEWKSRAVSARDRAIKACDLEAADQPISATEEWKKIFGSAFWL